MARKVTRKVTWKVTWKVTRGATGPREERWRGQASLLAAPPPTGTTLPEFSTKPLASTTLYPKSALPRSRMAEIRCVSTDTAHAESKGDLAQARLLLAILLPA
eukprot:2762964-Rhodomonas_salina.2